MNLTDLLQDAAKSAKDLVLENMDKVRIRTGAINPFGDKTLLLDKQAEDAIIAVLEESDVTFAFLTEEQGVVRNTDCPDYYAVIDPIDGSANLERGISLVSVGIALIPYSEHVNTDDVEVSLIDSFFTEETYIAHKGKGVTRNRKQVKPSSLEDPSTAIISYDTKKSWREGDFGQRSLNTIKIVHDVRRTGSNLLDLCWTACGALDAMVDTRGILPLVHVSGTHMVFEAGGYVAHTDGKRFTLPMNMDLRMSFVAAGTEALAKALAKSFSSVTI
jgi:myo-inositol-1(or 4)-monophosphatase